MGSLCLCVSVFIISQTQLEARHTTFSPLKSTFFPIFVHKADWSMSRVLLISVCLLSLCLQNSYTQTLSDRAEISLLTASPGRDLYAAFGHSAIWVNDPILGIDKVYNYGTFDFDPPAFYLKFARGNLNYRMAAESFRRFDRVYQYLERSYTSQTYNLTQAQKQAIYDYLEWNHLPENRYYLYDFFFDNCSSRLRDLFAEVLGDSLIMADPHRETDSTFRDMTDLYLTKRPWADFWIDLGLGSVVDRHTTPWDQMFLPDFLELELSKARVIQDGKEVPFVKSQKVLHDVPSVVEPTPWYLHPYFLMGIPFLIVAFFTWRNWSNIPERFRGDGILFTLSGLGGLVVALLWFATIHTATAWNWNLLWLTPTHLIAAVYLFRKQHPDWLKYYFLLSTVLSAIVLAFGIAIPMIQHMTGYALPWLLLVMLRSAVLYRKLSASD